MKGALRLILALAVSAAVVLAIRAFAFTVCRVPADGLVRGLSRGSLVIVDKVAVGIQKPGNVVVFSDGKGWFMGSIVQTTTLCGRCSCTDCRYYQVMTDSSHTSIVPHKSLIGTVIDPKSILP